MSEDPMHDEVTIQAGGGRAKWLIGAAAAVVVLGGGYLAWANFGPSQDYSQDQAQDYAQDNTSYGESYEPEPLRAGPLEPDRDALTDGAEEDAPQTQAETRLAPRRTPARPPAIPAAVPEETIGVALAAADSDEIVVTGVRRPIWVRTPSARRLSALYPERALERGREGEARLHCIVQDGGALDCERASETPGGFGNAALRVARGYRHSTTLADGSDAVGSPVNLRVVFRIADDDDRRRRG